MITKTMFFEGTGSEIERRCRNMEQAGWETRLVEKMDARPHINRGLVLYVFVVFEREVVIVEEVDEVHDWLDDPQEG